MAGSRVIGAGGSGSLADIERGWDIGVVTSKNSVAVQTGDDINHIGKVSIGQIAVGETLDVLGTFKVTNTFASTRIARLGLALPIPGLAPLTEGIGMVTSKGTALNYVAVGDMSPLGGSFRDNAIAFLAQDSGTANIALCQFSTNAGGGTDPEIALGTANTGGGSGAGFQMINGDFYLSAGIAGEDIDFNLQAGVKVLLDTSAVGAGAGVNFELDLGTGGAIDLIVKPTVDNSVTDLLGRNAVTGHIEVVETANIGVDALNNSLTNSTLGAISHDGNAQNWELVNVADLRLEGTTVNIEQAAASGGHLQLLAGSLNLSLKTTLEAINMIPGFITATTDVFQIRQATGATTPILRLYDNDDGQAISIKANDTTTTHTITLPADNAVGELTNDGAGGLTWVEGSASGARSEGEVYITASAVTDLTLANPSKVAGTTTLGGFDTDFDDDTGTNNRLRYTGTLTKVFRVIASFSVTSAGSNKVYEWKIYKNGVVITGSEIQRKQGTGTDVGAASISTLVELATNDYIELWVEGITDTTNPTVEFLNLSAE